MIRKLSGILCLVGSLLGLSSCLGTDDELTYYSDTAISSFSLGTLKRYYTTTGSKGQDSTYSASYTASSTSFYIDQVAGKIYNPDSLPKGVDAKHILCTIGTKNSGTVVLVLKTKDGKDSLAYYSSSDSINFSQPLVARVYNNAGTAYRSYTITVNIHQEDSTDMRWNSASLYNGEAIAAARMVKNDNGLYLFENSANATTLRYYNNGTWDIPNMLALPADAYKNAVAWGNKLYYMSEGKIMRSTNMGAWEQTGTNTQLTQLIGVTPTTLYALGTNGLYASADEGATWTLEALDDAATNLPTSDINLVVKKHRVNANTYKLVLMGNRDGKAVVWSKVEEENVAVGSREPWTFYTHDAYNIYAMPYIQNLQVISYDGGLLAFGGDFKTIWKSEDEGLTWKKDTLYALPTDGSFNFTVRPFALSVDADNIIHLYKAGDKLEWKGRLARATWAKEEKKFTE